MCRSFSSQVVTELEGGDSILGCVRQETHVLSIWGVRRRYIGYKTTIVTYKKSNPTVIPSV